MSSRSNTIIEDLGAKTEVCLYRHCDGYLEGAGFDLLDFAMEIDYSEMKYTSEQLADKLIEFHSGYELSPSGLHNDIEFIYKVEMSNGFIVSVKAFRPAEINDKICLGAELTNKLLELYREDGHDWKLESFRKYSSDVCSDDAQEDSAFIEVTNAGSLKIQKISIRKSAIITVAKPESGDIGCIIQLDGEKYPIKESYDLILRMLGEK